MKRSFYAAASAILFILEVLIGLFAHGFIRNYVGDVLVVILIYTICKTISPDKPKKWYILPLCILIFAYAVEFLQLWGFCDRLGIQNRLLRIIIGTGFSVGDLISYTVGVLIVVIYKFNNPGKKI